MISALAILSIALGAGAAAVVFAAVKAVLIRPLPYAHPDELVQLRTDFDQGGSQMDWVSWPDMRDVARENRSFTSLETYNYALFNLAGDSSALPEALYGLSVSAGMFPMLGVHPMLGRNILPEEARPGRDHEMILSYGLWVRRFHADPSVAGRSVQVNGHACTILGVMPEGFDFPMRMATTVSVPSGHMDFWAPEAVDPAKVSREATGFGAVARLAPGATLARANQDLSAIAARQARDYPDSNRGRTLDAGYLRDRSLGFAQTGLLLLMGAALVFLLIGCANVSNLLLARALGRNREMAIRAALGAGRARIFRQSLGESALLAALGGIAGFGLAAVAWRVLPTLAPPAIPRLSTARADWVVFLFALTAAVLSGILSGAAPAWRAARQQPGDALRQAGTRGTLGSRRDRARSVLVAAEVAITVVLVAIGGALGARFVRLLRTDPGFKAGGVVASIIVPSGDRYTNPANRTALFRGVLDSVRRLPGVQSAGAVDALPFTGENAGGQVAATQSQVAQGNLQPIAEVDQVTPGYLETMGVRLLAGREFRGEDLDSSHAVAIVNDIAAVRFWPGRSAIGQWICVNCGAARPENWKRVIGVVSAIRHSAMDKPPGLEVYLAGNSLATAVFLVVRTDRPSPALVRGIRGAVASVDPNQPVFLSATMASLIADSLSVRRFILTLVGITAVLALLLAAAGVYGAVSYATSRRTQEIALRLALGAAPRQIHALIFVQGMGAAAAGIVLGVPIALALAPLLRHSFAGAQAIDPVFGVCAVLLVTFTAAAACWLPARRAMRVDPAAALRQQ